MQTVFAKSYSLPSKYNDYYEMASESGFALCSLKGKGLLTRAISPRGALYGTRYIYPNSNGFVFTGDLSRRRPKIDGRTKFCLWFQDEIRIPKG